MILKFHFLTIGKMFFVCMKTTTRFSLVFICFILIPTQDAVSDEGEINYQVAQKIKNLQINIASKDAKVRKSALLEINLVMKKIPMKMLLKGNHPLLKTLSANVFVKTLEDSDGAVKKIAYYNLQLISYMNRISKFSEKGNGKPALDLSKNIQLRKHLLKIIVKDQGNDEIQKIALQVYYVNFPYDAEAKKKVIGQYWKAKKFYMKEGVIDSILIWKLSKSEEGHKILLAGIKDDNIEVRIAAIQVIQETTPPELLKPLIDRLNIREYTIRELSYITFAVLMYGEKARPYQNILLATQKELEKNRFDIENILKKLDKKDGDLKIKSKNKNKTD